MLNRAMCGTKDAAQCLDLYCEWTMEKLDCSIGVFNPCLYNHAVKVISVLGDDFAAHARRAHNAEFKEHLSNHLLVKHIATLGPRPRLLDSCEVRFLNAPVDCATVWKSARAHRTRSRPTTRGVVGPKFKFAVKQKKGRTHQESVRETVCVHIHFHHNMPRHTVPMS